MPQRIREHHDRAVDGDQFTDADPALAGEMDAVPDDRDQQDSRQQYLDRGDQGPQARAAHGRVADFLRGAAVAVEEQFLAADAAQYAQSGDGVGGEFGGPAGLVALHVRPPGGAGQQRQHRDRQHRQSQGDDDPE
ncbi:hypothetical protein SHKM778_58730 [Streptomyces sp. KM77-8]|uniref:Uncharacterized protein n=1 Tax=Streptomyces haneummycinicus TaxID=3074435 RepID=A0AAT9HPZ8_9ACTN